MGSDTRWRRAAVLLLLASAPAAAERLGLRDWRTLGALGRRLNDMAKGFRAPLVLRVATPTYTGEVKLGLEVSKGEHVGLRLRSHRDVATPLGGAGAPARVSFELLVDAEGLWLTARPLGEGTPERALALALPVEGSDPPAPRNRQGRGRGALESIPGGYRLTTADPAGRPVRLELEHDEGHWPTALRVTRGEDRRLSLEVGAITLGSRPLTPALPRAAYQRLDLVGLARMAPLWVDLSARLGAPDLDAVFPQAPGVAAAPARPLPKISLASLAQGDRPGFPALLKLTSIFDEAELLEGLARGVRKLRGALERGVPEPKRRGLLGRRRRGPFGGR